MDWRFEAFTAGGKFVRGEVASATHSNALDALARSGHVVVRLEPRAGARRHRQLRLADQAALLRELGALLEAQLPLDDALGAVAGSGASPAVRATAKAVRSFIREGVGVADALERAPTRPAALAIGIMRAGERQGDLAGAALRVATALERRAALQQALVSTLAYPAVLMVVTLLSLAFILLVAVPNLAPVLEAAGDGAPPAARLLLAASAGLKAYGAWVGVGLIIAVVAVAFWARSGNNRLLTERALFGLPVVGPTITAIEAANALRTTAGLLASGGSVPAALIAAADASSTRSFAHAMRDAAEAVRGGAELESALATAEPLPATVAAFAAVGTRTGRLADAILAAAERLEREVDVSVKRLLAILPPLLTVVLGIIVGGVVLTILSAIMSANEAFA